MRTVKIIAKWTFYVLLIPLTYLLASLALSAITVDGEPTDQTLDRTVYLSTNGVHLNIVIPVEDIDPSLAAQTVRAPGDQYLSFGWGDEAFYLNTPTWGDLTFQNAFTALFLKSPTLMHVSRYRKVHGDWVEVALTESELGKLNAFIYQSFSLEDGGAITRLEDAGYTANDDFYKAEGVYTCFFTCNTWVNSGFKKSGMKACVWTPFDFGLMNKYR